MGEYFSGLENTKYEEAEKRWLQKEGKAKHKNIKNDELCERIIKKTKIV